ncbi:hypothetical protein LguiB_005639 [Lonicera macranthoides]
MTSKQSEYLVCEVLYNHLCILAGTVNNIIVEANIRGDEMMKNHCQIIQEDEPKDSTGARSWSEDYADPIGVPSVPITRAGEKKIKESLMTMVQKMMSKAEVWRRIEGDGEQEWKTFLKGPVGDVTLQAQGKETCVSCSNIMEGSVEEASKAVTDLSIDGSASNPSEREEAAKPSSQVQKPLAADDEDMDPTQYFENRLKALAAQKEAWKNPYPHKIHVSISVLEYVEKYGGLSSGEHLKDVEDEAEVSKFHSGVKRGDIVGIKGFPGDSEPRIVIYCSERSDSVRRLPITECCEKFREALILLPPLVKSCDLPASSRYIEFTGTIVSKFGWPQLKSRQ